MRKTWLFALAGLFALPAWAEEAPPLEDLVAEILQSNPKIQVASLQVEESRALEQPAGALPDPMVDLQLSRLGFPRLEFGSQAMVLASVRQNLLYSKKRLLASQLAAGKTTIRREELEALRAQLVLAAYEAYAALYVIDRNLELVADSRELLKAILASARKRYVAGLTSQESLVKVAIEETRLAEMDTDLRRQRAEFVALFNRLRDRPLGSPLGTVRRLPPLDPPPPQWDQQALHQAPELLVARANVEAANRAVAVAQRALKPNLFLAAGLGSQREMGSMANLGVGLEWPLWKKSKQEPQLVAARLQFEAAKAQEAAAAAQVRELIERAEAAWQAAQEQLARYQGELVPQAEAALAAAQAAFLVGQADFSTVVEDFRLWLEVKTQLARRSAELFVARAKIRYLLGELGGEK